MNGDEMLSQEWLYPEQGPDLNQTTLVDYENEPLPTVKIEDTFTETMEPLPEDLREQPIAPVRRRSVRLDWLSIRPRSILNAVPNVVFYPATFLGLAWLLTTEKRWAPRGYAALWLGLGVVSWALYSRASEDAGRVMRGEMSWDQWEAKHPLQRHLWAFLGRFAH